MNKEELDKYLLSFKGSVLTFPFDNITKVFKIHDKMFALVNDSEDIIRINLKGLPEDNFALRNMFDSIKPGYHMNKEHWNSVYMDGTLEDDLVKRLIGESYDIVFNKLSKKVRNDLVNKLN